MDTPDASYVRRRSRYDLSQAGFPSPTGNALDPLEDEVADAVEYVESVTWRKLDATMPDPYARMAARAVWLRVEQQIVTGDPDMVDVVNDEVTQSQSAGGASESRKDPGRRGEQSQINPNPDLARLLWLVMTPEAVAWWKAFLSNQMPAIPLSALQGGFHVTEVAWDLVHAEPYSDVRSGYHSTYLNPVDPGDLPYVPDPYGEQ